MNENCPKITESVDFFDFFSDQPPLCFMPIILVGHDFLSHARWPLGRIFSDFSYEKGTPSLISHCVDPQRKFLHFWNPLGMGFQKIYSFGGVTFFTSKVVTGLKRILYLNYFDEQYPLFKRRPLLTSNARSPW